MAIDFASIAHQYVYEKTRSYLRELYGKFGRHETEPSFLVTLGEAHAHVIITPIGQVDGMIRVLAVVATGVDTSHGPLLRRLLEMNADLDTAAFGIDSEGNVFVHHCHLGSFCDKGQLNASIGAVLTAAAACTGEIEAALGQAPDAPPSPMANAPAEPAKPAKPSAKEANTAGGWRSDMARLKLDDFGIYYCIRGLPIGVNEVLALIDEGKTDDEVLDAYPDLEEEDLVEVRRFGPKLREEMPDPEPEPEPDPTPAPSFAIPPRHTHRSESSDPDRPRRIRLDEYGIYYCIRGLPISVEEVLERIDAGRSDAEVLAEYPALTSADLVEARRFGPDLIAELKAKEPEPEPEPDPALALPQSPPRRKPEPPKAAPKSDKKTLTLRRIKMDSYGIYYCIRGLPISVDEVIERIADGRSDEEILAEYTDLVPEDLAEVRLFRDHHPSRAAD